MVLAPLPGTSEPAPFIGSSVKYPRVPPFDPTTISEHLLLPTDVARNGHNGFATLLVLGRFSAARLAQVDLMNQVRLLFLTKDSLPCGCASIACGKVIICSPPVRWGPSDSPFARLCWWKFGQDRSYLVADRFATPTLRLCRQSALRNLTRAQPASIRWARTRH
jgi:hypothetical protein